MGIKKVIEGIVTKVVDYGKSHSKFEREIASILSKSFSKVKVYRNLYVPYSTKGYTEVDIVAVTNIGVLVVECKNYKGKIIGDVFADKWIQVVGRRRYELYNPIAQNINHIRTLADRTGVPVNEFVNIIVFSDNADLDEVPRIFDGGFILKHTEFENLIKQLETSIILIDDEARRICNILKKFRDFDGIKKIDHVSNIKEKRK